MNFAKCLAATRNDKIESELMSAVSRVQQANTDDIPLVQESAQESRVFRASLALKTTEWKNKNLH